MRTRLWMTVALLAAAAGASAGQSQPPDQLIGRPIVDVRLSIGGRETRDAELTRVLETHAGAALTTEAVRESIVHLMALERFQDVRVDATAASGGVVLLYELVPVYSVGAIRFVGTLGLPERQLRSAVVERYTSTPPASRAEEIATMLEAFYRDHGYLTAVVRSNAEVAHHPDRTTLVFQITCGAPARIGTVEVEGAPGGDTRAVASALGLRAGSRLDRPALDEAVTKYTAALRGKGYLEAKVETEPVYAPDGSRADITVRMSRGPRVTVGFRGDPLSDKRRAEIQSLFKEGALDEDFLENEQRSIEDELRARGYRDAAAPFSRESRGDDQLLVVFTVKQGLQYRVAGVNVTGNRQVTLPEIQPAMRVAAGQWFVKALVDADASEVAELYRQRGFRNVRVTWTAAPRAGDSTQMDVEMAIDEGTPTVIGSVVFEGNSAIGTATLMRAIRSRAGGPFYQRQVDDDRENVLYEYRDQGYQQASVTVPAAFSQDGARFDLRFVIAEGSRTLIDHILVVGNIHTSSATIERELGLATGQPLSDTSLSEAQRRLSALGLFRRVQVTPLQRGGEVRRDVLVVVEEAPVNSVSYGGGLEVAQRVLINGETRVDVSPRGFFEIGRRNLWGKNRSIDLFARGAIRSSGSFAATTSDTGSGAATTPAGSTSDFHEYRLVGTYREPRFLNTPVDVLVSAAVDQAIRSTFDFNRRQVNVEGSHRFGTTLSVAGHYSFGRTVLLNAEQVSSETQLEIDRLFPRVRLSEFSASVIRSTRDDAFDPTRGTLTSFDTTVAARAIGSQVGFVKMSLQGFVYHRVPVLRGAVLAAGARLGLATGFPEPGQSVTLEQDIPPSERFFAGGDTTVRGFTLDQLGAAGTLDQNGVAQGGDALLIFNGELRFPVWAGKGLGGAAFIDTGNVFAKVGDVSLADLRSGAGFGIRWKSPVGPLRVDLAWKLKPIQFASGVREDRFAFYVTIGQAF